MNLLETIILAFVQGITEYLPISSTAHLIVTQKLLNQDPNTFLIILLQLGTTFASIVYFRKKLFNYSKDAIRLVKSKSLFSRFNIVWIFLGIIPTLIAGFLLKDYLDFIYKTPLLITFSIIFFGIVFYVIELLNKRSNKNLEIKNLKFINVLVVGSAQIFALIPGVSRSGSTIAAGLIQKFNFKTSIELSFLMSIPVMFIASAYQIVKNYSLFTPDLILNLIVGLIVSYFAGILSIKLTLGFLQKKGFLPFAIYRLILGIFILIVLI